MKIYYAIFLIALFPAGVTFGIFLGAFGEIQLMGDYDLYNCIYNNADANGFNQHPLMIEKIQQECICFKGNNYTNIFDSNCGEVINKSKEEKVTNEEKPFSPYHFYYTKRTGIDPYIGNYRLNGNFNLTDEDEYGNCWSYNGSDEGIDWRIVDIEEMIQFRRCKFINDGVKDE